MEGFTSKGRVPARRFTTMIPGPINTDGDKEFPQRSCPPANVNLVTSWSFCFYGSPYRLHVGNPTVPKGGHRCRPCRETPCQTPTSKTQELVLGVSEVEVGVYPESFLTYYVRSVWSEFETGTLYTETTNRHRGTFEVFVGRRGLQCNFSFKDQRGGFLRLGHRHSSRSL